jgi:rhamnosyltransferase
MIQRTPRTTAVVVTYHPDRERLSALLEALTLQATAIVVVDNGSEPEAVAWLEKEEVTGRIHLRLLDENRGVAAAQNVGIEVARELQSDYVVLFDHDSLPASEMIPRLIEAAEKKKAEGWRVASVGPRYVDQRQNNPPPFIRVVGLRLERRTCASPDSVVEADYLISSGCLIPMETIRAVGSMREDLFIDYIDIEWGLRAKAHGYQSFGVCGAEMSHSLGEDPIPFLGKKFPNHSPERHYYHFRNASRLYREPWVPFNWKLVDALRLVMKFGFYSLFAQPRQRHFSMMARGIYEGLFAQMPISVKTSKHS